MRGVVGREVEVLRACTLQSPVDYRGDSVANDILTELGRRGLAYVVASGETWKTWHATELGRVVLMASEKRQECV